jgi:hypothetical protein
MKLRKRNKPLMTIRWDIPMFFFREETEMRCKPNTQQQQLTWNLRRCHNKLISYYELSFFYDLVNSTDNILFVIENIRLHWVMRCCWWWWWWSEVRSKNIACHIKLWRFIIFSRTKLWDTPTTFEPKRSSRFFFHVSRTPSIIANYT